MSINAAVIILKFGLIPDPLARALSFLSSQMILKRQSYLNVKPANLPGFADIPPLKLLSKVEYSSFPPCLFATFSTLWSLRSLAQNTG